jgi:type IV pilus assembly protein PilV
MACLHSCRRQSAGGSLIEVLVSVLVLSIGLLGASALQVTGLRNNQSNYEHAQMTVLTQSMLDAMRNNLAGVEAGEYEIAAWTCAAPAGATLAADDVAQWIDSVQAQIHPGACGRITCPGAGRDCTVGIRWDDSRATGGSDTQAFEIRSRL